MNAPDPILRIARDGAYKHWTTPEIAVVREVYPLHGPQAVAERLPHRSLMAIYQQAQKLGLKAPARLPSPWSKGKKKWTTSDAIDAQIRLVYETGIGRGEVNALARRLMRPRYWVVQRAAALGLKTPRFKELPWRVEEEDYLAQLTGRGHTLPVIARKMREKGYARTATACMVKLKRLGVSRRGDGTEAWSANQLARLMGVDPTTVGKRWIRLEGLAAKRRGTERTEAQGGDEYLITRDALRRWLKDHAQSVDLRKVDKFFFWSVVFN